MTYEWNDIRGIKHRDRILLSTNRKHDLHDNLGDARCIRSGYRIIGVVVKCKEGV